MARGLAVALLLCAPRVALSWWDEGHMLVAAVGHLSTKNVHLYNAALECDDSGGEFANFSNIVSAAAWADHVKCREGDMNPWCVGLAQRARVGLFEAWHVAKQTYDPENLGDKLPIAAKSNAEQWVKQDKYWFVTGQMALAEIGNSFASRPTSPWSWGFHLRIALHIFGDLHQPLHTTDLYSAAFPHGDQGGNLIGIADPAKAKWANLHSLWDSGAGTMGGSLDTATTESALLRAEGLTKVYPPAFFIKSGRLSADWNNPAKSFGIPTLPSPTSGLRTWLQTWIGDTFKLVPQVYEEYLAQAKGDPKTPYLPSERYLKEAERISGEQVTLGGYRLASFLNYHDQFLPKDGCVKPKAVTSTMPALETDGRETAPDAGSITWADGDWLPRILVGVGGLIVGVAIALVVDRVRSRKRLRLPRAGSFELAAAA